MNGSACSGSDGRISDMKSRCVLLVCFEFVLLMTYVGVSGCRSASHRNQVATKAIHRENIYD